MESVVFPLILTGIMIACIIWVVRDNKAEDKKKGYGLELPNIKNKEQVA